MNPQTWQKIRTVFSNAQRAAMHCSIASVDAAMQPNITPIGTLFLHETEFSGIFFDSYAESLGQNLAVNPKACIQAINSSKLFWLSSLLKGQFLDYPGVRLYVTIGEKRPATTEELHLVQQRIRMLKWTKGSKLIWNDFNQVRDFQVHAHKWVEYPQMMP